MDLVADRFAVLANGRSFDLASGRSVRFVTSSSGGRSEHTRWVHRCDRFFRLRHRSIARLVDFGTYGEMRRFEAWRCDALWLGARAEADAARRAAVAFLSAGTLSVGTLETAAVHSCNGRPVLVPDAECGIDLRVRVLVAQDFSPAVSSPAVSSLPLHHCGLAIVQRRAMTALAELFSQSCGARPRAVALWGRPGAGVRTAMADLSRAARLQGFIPIHHTLIGSQIASITSGRSVCLIVDNDVGEVEGWRRLIERSLESPSPHVLLFAGRREIRHIDGLELEAVAADQLVQAVVPAAAAGLDEAVRSRVTKAAGQAKGNPGLFVRLLWGSAPDAPERAAYGRTRAAEQQAVYGDAETGGGGQSGTTPPGSVVVWPEVSELTAFRRRAEASIELLERGRHESGSRALRQAVGALTRRHDWAHAAKGLLALASALLRRGRPREARAVVVEAQEYAARAGQDASLWLEAAVLAGVASLDLARLDEAETVLHGAVASARALDDPSQVAATRLALARCLFWRGRYDEAHQTLLPLEHMEEGRWTAVTSIRIAVLMSRIAVGQRDAARAVSKATAALEAAQRLAHPGSIAHAAYASSFAHLAVGDRAGMERDIAACVQASRPARTPLCAVRARLIGAEHAYYTGEAHSSASVLARLAKVPAAHLPSTVRARCAVLTELRSSSAPAIDIVKRHVAATGLEALSLFAPGVSAGAGSADHAILDAALEILRCCQVAEDGQAVLIAVAARLRKQLRAAAIVFASRQGIPIASDGARVDSRMADRVLAAGQPIMPHQCNGAIEGGAPVRYGGETIATLVGRWTLGTPHDSSRAVMALTLAATAAGPAVAEVVSRGRETPIAALGEIIGASVAISEVRRSVERAAAAPFPVLVEGESGSGKELVARALHRCGQRRDRPFCAINCAALPDELVESELFGHARGAFTGAAAERPGVFEEAHTGTLFLDEIGELSPRAQAKVLRVIQDGELRRVGENISRRVDVRIVAATNRDLQKEAAAGRFRLDLLYRLDVVRITVPPLRERRDDIAVLAERFWQDATKRLGSRAVLGSATLTVLTRYDWPGNVRELQNVLASLAVRSPRRGVVPPTALPPSLISDGAVQGWRLDEARRSFEERFVRAALVRTAGHRIQAAEQLGVTRQGLTKLMSRLGITD